MPNFFAKNLKHLRVQQGETQAGLAIHVGKGQTTIGNWETGFSQPNIEELTLLSNFFGIDIDAFITTDVADQSTQQKNKGATHSAGYVKEPTGVYSPSLEDAVHQRDAVIAALQGQIEALKMTVAQMQARLSEPDNK